MDYIASSFLVAVRIDLNSDAIGGVDEADVHPMRDDNMKTEQHRIGERAEKRLAAYLRDRYGCWVNTDNGNNPDLRFGSDKLKHEYACEVKSVYQTYKNNRFGYAKVTQEQVIIMEKMRSEVIKPIMIAELRSNNHHSMVYMVVDWKKVYMKWAMTTPLLMSLTFFQILQMGINLDFWMKLIQAGVNI